MVFAAVAVALANVALIVFAVAICAKKKNNEVEIPTALPIDVASSSNQSSSKKTVKSELESKIEQDPDLASRENYKLGKTKEVTPKTDLSSLPPAVPAGSSEVVISNPERPKRRVKTAVEQARREEILWKKRNTSGEKAKKKECESVLPPVDPGRPGESVAIPVVGEKRIDKGDGLVVDKRGNALSCYAR